MNQQILVTGGVGYIGSHTCLLLLEAGFDVIVFDNLSNSSLEPINRVESLSEKKIKFYRGDMRDIDSLQNVFSENKIAGVIHFAGLKAVGESTQIPLEYYEQNIFGTINLIKVMQQFGCHRLVFSSTATVYGDPETVPINETFPTAASNPYGRTKLFIEEMLRDVAASDPQWKMVILRYFNPIGAHESGLIGEDPLGIPNNLMPFISQVAVGKREKLSIFGNDYQTHDGTGVRDYIHVMDLSEAHVKAIEKIGTFPNVTTLNLGTGKGYSVMQIVDAFQSETNIKINYQIVARRPGDIAEYWADPTLAQEVLGWKTTRNLKDMILDSWRWQSKNPDGYKS